jgi:hypothetical protein
MGSILGKKEEENDWNHFIEKSRETREMVYEQNHDTLEKFDSKLDSSKKEITEKKIHKVELNTYLEGELISEPHYAKVDTFTIKGKVISKIEHDYLINVYFQCIENIDNEGKFLGINFKRKLPPFKFSKKEETLIFELDLHNIPLHELREDINNNLYHLCIEIIEKNIISVYIYTLNVKLMFTPHLIRKGVVIDGKYIALKSIYGIVNMKGDNNAEKCIICFDNNVNTVIKPCNHMCLCKECSIDFKNNSAICPICREKFDSFEAFVL